MAGRLLWVLSLAMIGPNPHRTALSLSLGAARTNPTAFSVREISEAELIAVLRIPNTEDQAG